VAEFVVVVVAAVVAALVVVVEVVAVASYRASSVDHSLVPSSFVVVAR